VDGPSEGELVSGINRLKVDLPQAGLAIFNFFDKLIEINFGSLLVPEPEVKIMTHHFKTASGCGDVEPVDPTSVIKSNPKNPITGD